MQLNRKTYCSREWKYFLQCGFHHKLNTPTAGQSITETLITRTRTLQITTTLDWKIKYKATPYPRPYLWVRCYSSMNVSAVVMQPLHAMSDNLAATLSRDQKLHHKASGISRIIEVKPCETAAQVLGRSWCKRKRNDANVNAIDHRTILSRTGTIESSALHEELSWKGRASSNRNTNNNKVTGQIPSSSCVKS